jgi:hypothetical protein
MQNITLHTGILKVIKRLPSSYFGNPRFLVWIDGVNCKTAVDSMLGYAIQNFDNKEVVATIGTHYGVATLNSVKAV